MRVRPIHFVPDVEAAVRFYEALGLRSEARSRSGHWPPVARRRARPDPRAARRRSHVDQQAPHVELVQVDNGLLEQVGAGSGNQAAKKQVVLAHHDPRLRCSATHLGWVIYRDIHCWCRAAVQPARRSTAGPM
jgi:hypothetical protein